MALSQISDSKSEIPSGILVSRVMKLHGAISLLDSLKPSNQVNSLLTELVNLCIVPCMIDIEEDLPDELKPQRQELIGLCGEAEGLLELKFASLIVKTQNPVDNLTLFPYYNNYVKLARLEYSMLAENGVLKPKKVAFLGSGPMPLTSLVLARNHYKTTHFDNFDFDETANALARQLVAADTDLGKRMKFETTDVNDLREKLGEYDCIFLAALVGMKREEKLEIMAHVRKYMKEGAVLLVRSAKGARAFLYPVIEPCDMVGFDVLDVFHPSDEVINSVILARKPLF